LGSVIKISVTGWKLKNGMMNTLKGKILSADELIRYTEILAKNNHITKGEPLLKSYTEKYPDDHRLWSRYGFFSMWLGKKEIAIIAFEKARLDHILSSWMDIKSRRGKGYFILLTIQHRFNYGCLFQLEKEYPIDKYYRVLSKIIRY
jgi:hypothetical protein